MNWSRSKTTPIHVPVQNQIWIIHTQEVTLVCYYKQLLKIIYCLSHKIIYASKIIYLYINGFSQNSESSHLHICDHSIVTLGIREKCLGLSNTSHVDSLDRFIITFADKVNTYMCLLKQGCHSK